ncbi:MAG: M15 family metallopeptidase [Porticoccaceae bacterium]|nr:M15 family metallopeptidase [Porticoccaceae bacterium]
MSRHPDKSKSTDFALSRQSLRRLEGVHPDLVRIVKNAITITMVDFGVGEGLRTVDRQRILVNSGASSSMNSRHLTGHAVDLVAYIGNQVSWDWPLYYKIADAMKTAAFDMDVGLSWGGDWATLKDGPHFQLSWVRYPLVPLQKKRSKSPVNSSLTGR